MYFVKSLFIPSGGAALFFPLSALARPLDPAVWGKTAPALEIKEENGLIGHFSLGKACSKVREFCRREAVLCIGAVLTLLSMAAVPPGPSYASYIDLRVLCLLFCLMAVVLGLQECGLFRLLAQFLLTGQRRMRLLRALLVLLPFFCSMAVTNDVALLTFVPFAILVLSMTGKERELPYVLTLQTLAANLGSMATPVGNPQNLYLYAKYQLTAADFFRVLLPLTIASLLGLLAASLWGRSGGEQVRVDFPKREKLSSPGKLAGIRCSVYTLSAVGLSNSPLWDPYRRSSGRPPVYLPRTAQEGGLQSAADLCLLFYLCRKHRPDGGASSAAEQAFGVGRPRLFRSDQPGD